MDCYERLRKAKINRQKFANEKYPFLNVCKYLKRFLIESRSTNSKFRTTSIIEIYAHVMFRQYLGTIIKKHCGNEHIQTTTY